MRKIFFITLPALLIFLIALELGLRLYGYLYVQSHHPGVHAKAAEFSKDEFRILCLGDSFTWGFGANPESSYPKQLEKILQKNISKKIRVINGGRLANTSSLLLKKLPADIDKYSPSMIVVMIGMNNWWNLEDSSYFLLYGGSMNFFERLKESLSSLRTYKLFKIGFLNLKSKKEVSQQKPDDHGFSRKAKDQSSELRRISQSLFDEGKNDLAVEKAKEALKIDSTDHRTHMLLAKALLPLGQRQAGQEEVWRTVYLVKEWDADLVGNIVNIFMHIDSGDDLVLFKKHLRENVEKKKADVFIKTIDASSDLRTNHKTTGAVLDYDLGQIAGLTRRKGIKLILQTYPDENVKQVNNVTMIAASQKYHTCLVDNEMIFNGKPRNEFFVADGHCNEKGYRLMAENVYKTLVNKEMLPVGSAGVRDDGR